MRFFYAVLLLVIATVSVIAQAQNQNELNPNWIKAVEWNPTGSQIALATLGGNIKILDAKTGDGILALRDKNPSLIYTLAWSPDSTKLALQTTALVEPGTPGSYPEPGLPEKARLFSILILDLNNGKVVTNITSGVNYIAWHSDGIHLAGTDYEATLYIWNVMTGMLIDQYSTSSYRVKLLRYSPYGEWLMVAFNPSIPNNQSGVTPISIVSKTELGGLIRVLFPTPSLALLDSIQATCVPTKPPAALSTSNELDLYIEAVKADTSIPPACAADLIAVAEALQAEQSTSP